MSNWKKILIKILWSLAGIAMIVLFVFAWRAKTTKKCKSIDIVLTGNNGGFLFMDEKEILKLVNEQGVKVGTPIEAIPLHKIQQVLLATKWVEKATLYLDNQQQLNIHIEQRVPIARVFTVSGNSFYIDKVAQKLPLRQLSVLRLPVFTGFPSDLDKLSKPDSIILQNVLTFSKVIQKDSFFMAQIAQVNIAPSGEFEMIPTIGSHMVLIGSIDQIEDKLSGLFTFYKKVLVPAGINAYEVLDLRFDHQLVALKKGLQPIQYPPGIFPFINLDSNATEATPLMDSATLSKLSITAAAATLSTTTSSNNLLKTDTAQKKEVIKKEAIKKEVTKTVEAKKGTPKKESAPKMMVKKEPAKAKTIPIKDTKVDKPKQNIKENNNPNNKTLNNTKATPKAILPKKPTSTNN